MKVRQINLSRTVFIHLILIACLVLGSLLVYPLIEPEQAQAQPPAGTIIEVLWDATNGVNSGWSPNGTRYDLLRQSFNGWGYNLTVLSSGGVDLVDLSLYDVLVIGLEQAWTNAYNASEAAAIKTFVENGGGLIIMGMQGGGYIWWMYDIYGYIITGTLNFPYTNINPVAEAFGASFTGVDRSGSAVQKVHPIFSEVSDISF